MNKTAVTFIEAIGDDGLINDGDWIESKDQDINGRVRLIQLADIGDGIFLNKSQKFVSTDTVNRLNCTLLHEGDVLIARMPDPLGRACVFPKLGTPAITAVDICIVRANKMLINPDWLVCYLNSPAVRSKIQNYAQGATRARVPTSKIKHLMIQRPPIEQQHHVATSLKAQLVEVEKARQAAAEQLNETIQLANAIIYDSLNGKNVTENFLGDVLEEVKSGIGKDWANYPVLGATRDGLAPAKEPPGKQPERYKPAFPGTVFYNPMRILIGSIAFVDNDNEPGITSPDYVALKGRKSLVDSRWFYYWLRSSLGKQCINSLARGAVRERMLFNRLANGKINLPDYDIQKKASKALAELKPMQAALQHKLNEINLLPGKILSLAFEI